MDQTYELFKIVIFKIFVQSSTTRKMIASKLTRWGTSYSNMIRSWCCRFVSGIGHGLSLQNSTGNRSWNRRSCRSGRRSCCDKFRFNSVLEDRNRFEIFRTFLQNRLRQKRQSPLARDTPVVNDALIGLKYYEKIFTKLYNTISQL